MSIEYRKKGNSLRIALRPSDKLQNIPYIVIEPKECWCSTFRAWGPEIDDPIIEICGKQYRIGLEEIKK